MLPRREDCDHKKLQQLSSVFCSNGSLQMPSKHGYLSNCRTWPFTERLPGIDKWECKNDRVSAHVLCFSLGRCRLGCSKAISGLVC